MINQSFHFNFESDEGKNDPIIMLWVRVHQIAILNFILNISICLGLHFVLTQIKMT